MKTVSDFDTRYVNGKQVFAFNVKVYGDLGKVDYAKLRAELGLEGKKCPPKKGAEPREFDREWIEAHYGSSSSFYEGPYTWAIEQGWEELLVDADWFFSPLGYLNSHSKYPVYSDGRSGGWCIVDGLPGYQDMQRTEELLAEIAKLEEKEKEPISEQARMDLIERIDELMSDTDYMSLEDYSKLMLALEGFENCIKEGKENFGRNVAWNVGANVFEHELTEWEEGSKLLSDWLLVSNEVVGFLKRKELSHSIVTQAIDVVLAELKAKKGEVA